MPRRAPDGPGPETGPPLARWLHTPRPHARPGIWRLGHVPRPPREADPVGDRELHGGAALGLLGGLLVWSLYANGYLPPVDWPLYWIGLDSWGSTTAGITVVHLYQVLFGCALCVVFGRIGNAPRLWRRWRPRVLAALRCPADAPPLPRAATVRALAALVAGFAAWRLSFGGVWLFWLEPLYAVVPDAWWTEGDTGAYVAAYNAYYVLYTAALGALAAWLGGWRSGWRALRPPGPEAGPDAVDRTRWEEVRAAGAPEAADRLAAEARSGAMSDLDHVRIERVWRSVRARPTALPAFAEAVLADGAGAFRHPSGQRDLAVRTARHDVLTGQVLIGRAPDDPRTPYEHRGAPVALDPDVLGTSLLAVGPPGSGKTGRVVRPLVESLCLQALAGRAAVVAVGTARSALGPDDAFDVIIRVGDPATRHRLDLYGGAADTDEAAALLAEALVGGDGGATGNGDAPARAAAALAQLLGPYRAAYGHFPGVPELRALLDGAPALLATLRGDLDHAGAWDQQRELDARERAAARPDDIGRELADRLAVLDRAGFAATPARPAAPRPRLFALSALEHPLRVRVDLPDSGHAEAGRILTRLLLAQFASAAAARADRSVFACLVLDDATAAVTRGTVRGLSRLRAAGAGAVLALRTLDEVPEALRTGLLGAVGGRLACSGITTWDAEHFAAVWGTQWTEDRDVTSAPDRAGGVLRRTVRAVRRLLTGREATTETVTVRRVERERWSASELAHRVPPGHAVLSLTTVAGESGPPVLVRFAER